MARLSYMELKEVLRNIQMEYIKESQEVCFHEWKEEYTPITEFGSIIPVWSRECNKCKKLEFTNEYTTREVLEMVPRFR